MLGNAILLEFFMIFMATVMVLRNLRYNQMKNKVDDKEREENFDDINNHLQNDLRNKLVEKINEVKQNIKFKKLQQDKNVKHLLKQQEDEIAIKHSQFMIEKLEIESKYKRKIQDLEAEVAVDVDNLKDSLKNLQIILATSGDSGDTVTNTRSELECPVCLEEMRPPKK